MHEEGGYDAAAALGSSGAQTTTRTTTEQQQQQQADASEWVRGAADAAEADRWEPVGLLSHLDAVRAVAMDAEAEGGGSDQEKGGGRRWLLSSSDDGSVKLWTVPEQPQPPTEAGNAPLKDYEPLATYRGIDFLPTNPL